MSTTSIDRQMDELHTWYRERVKKRYSVPEGKLQTSLQEYHRCKLHASQSTGQLSPSVEESLKSFQDQDGLLYNNDSQLLADNDERSCDGVEVSSQRSSSVFSLFVQRLGRPAMKKSEASKLPTIKNLKITRSPNLPKKQSPPDGLGQSAKPRPPAVLQIPADEGISRSTEDLETAIDVAGVNRENGSSTENALDDIDGHTPDPVRTKTAIEHLQLKIVKTKEQIKAEQAAKEGNVNEYLRLVTNADKQQRQRIKGVFEKKNQKSTQAISQLQKKLEHTIKKLEDVKQNGVSSHKQAKDVLRDVGHGLKGVGANIVDGITGFSGGVVDNIKGAKDTIVSKPKEFAHLIKNKFGSADNINTKSLDDNQVDEADTNPQPSTLPASFKYGSDDDNSSITSGSGFGPHSSPQSNSQNASQHLPVLPHINLEPLIQELCECKESNRKLMEMYQRLQDDFECSKGSTRQEVSVMKNLLDEERYRCERLEEQINDLTELHQNEMTNLRQDVTSMEEKIEYQLEERTRDIHEMLENNQTRVSKMELQQQQQQIISMEMVENVTFRTLLTKLINVALALVAVILVFVSTAAHLIAPFLTTRTRIITTVLSIILLVMLYQKWTFISSTFDNIWQDVSSILTDR